MMAQPEQKTAASRGDAVVVRSPWRSLVLSFDTKCGAGESDEASAARLESALDLAFAYHMQDMLRHPTLDVDLVNHCNLNCTCCCHYSPIAEPGFLSLDDYERDLVLLAKVEGVEEFFDAICLMGGEPLLHPLLADIVRLTRTHLPKMTIRLVTNGLLLGDASTTVWGALRDAGAEILITPYPVGIDYAGLVDLARGQGVRAVLGGGIATTEEGEAYFLKTPLDETGSQDPAKAFVSCPLAGTTMQLYDRRIYPCNKGALFDRLNERFGTSFTHEPGDYLELADIRSAQEIDDFRRTKKPMCRYCAHGLTERVVWGKSTRLADEWLVSHDECACAARES